MIALLASCVPMQERAAPVQGTISTIPGPMATAGAQNQEKKAAIALQEGANFTARQTSNCLTGARQCVAAASCHGTRQLLQAQALNPSAPAADRSSNVLLGTC